MCDQVFKRPWPGMMSTVYGNHERFETTYFKKFPGYYTTGDGKLTELQLHLWLCSSLCCYAYIRLLLLASSLLVRQHCDFSRPLLAACNFSRLLLIVCLTLSLYYVAAAKCM